MLHTFPSDVNTTQTELRFNELTVNPNTAQVILLF